MPTIIKDKKLTDSPFKVASGDDIDISASHQLLPLAVWLANRETLSGRSDVGVWLDAGEEIEALESDLDHLPVIGLNFPTFFDGRNLSSASMLRRKFAYPGEIRAIGDVRRDQLDQMHRCGINAFELAEGQDEAAALASLDSFTYNYQASSARPEPLFRQRA